MDYIGRGEHEEFVKRMEEEHKRQNKRITAVEIALEHQNELTLSIKKMAINMEHMLEEQKRQGEEIKELKEAPVKSWNTVKTAILSAIGGAIGTGIIAGIINYL